MKNTQLFYLISSIDDKYIEEAQTYENKSSAKADLKRIFTAAACVLLVIGLTSAGVRMIRTGDHEDTKPPVTHTTEPPIVSASDFVVENGILLSYTGNETEIFLPSGITKIAANCFSSAKNPDEITSITLNSEIKMIEQTAFSGLSALDKITVPEDNTNFHSNDGIISTADGKFYFAPITYAKDPTAFFKLIETMNSAMSPDTKTAQISIGDAILTVDFQKSIIGSDTYTYMYMSALAAYGHEIKFDPTALHGGYPLNGNFEIDFIQTDTVFVMQMTVNGIGDKWLFCQDGVYEFYDTIDSADYLNQPVISFETRSDGKIGYLKRPRKYIVTQTCESDILNNCTSLDEICTEQGYISFSDKDIIYNAEKAYTVSEVFDIDKLFAEWKKIAANSPELSHIASLEELIEYNKSK